MRKPNKLVALIFAILASIAMLLPTSAYAANGTNNDNGSITINNAEPGHTYNAYQVLVLESYNTDKGVYSYKANTDWADWLAKQTQYVSIDEGYVTWVKGADVKAFAKAALAHATEAKIAAKATKTADSATVSFTGLNLGYYLVDTTVGTLCSLDTTTPDVVMEEKNDLPGINKEVKEDSTGEWGDKNTAEIGDTVEFKTTITAKAGAESYVLHDVMSKGLTLNAGSIKVQVGGSDLAAANYTVKTTGLTDGCTFEIVFHQSYLDTITSDTNIVVTYDAVVNEKAAVYPSANPNKTQLEYGNAAKPEDRFTPPSETETYTYKVDVVKTDGDNKVLDGAKFKLYDAENGGKEIPLVKVSDGVYRFAKDGEPAVGTITTVNGQLEIKGFDANTTYWLEETKAPEGYNKLAGRVEIAVKDANIDATVDGGIWHEGDGGVHIVNKTGNELPSTGGIGTAIFYALGGALVLGAIVFLSRKRVK
ncbi:putative collagen-binding protein [Bifidobacterium pullorum subsp. gallinarum]|uniref:Putative collagen-binding protein n=1 Tax=Bifidobacterium pullorum subsp. gallinarum TaxID=78344 RepID=A0A087APT9_9BIFI|nr:SpaH/EbpB family LPXTG-anchored major pilin [Bifidobacterium pullorum]KFI60789.1 putative collagen-binding protein [Bifidobacterium pullorum subsp. gallinarum]